MTFYILLMKKWHGARASIYNLLHNQMLWHLTWASIYFLMVWMGMGGYLWAVILFIKEKQGNNLIHLSSIEYQLYPNLLDQAIASWCVWTCWWWGRSGWRRSWQSTRRGCPRTPRCTPPPSPPHRRTPPRRARPARTGSGSAWRCQPGMGVSLNILIREKNRK